MLVKGCTAILAIAIAAAAAPTSAPTSDLRGLLKADGFTSEQWKQGFAKAQAVVASLSLEQKLNFTDIPASGPPGCAGSTFPLPQAGIEAGLCYADSPTGIQSAYSTQFPADITTAATFDRDLIYRRASAMSAEYARLGAQVPLSIVVGPMGRSVYNGRNWEGLSPDAFLAGEAVRYTVKAFQENKVTGLVKHFVGYEQEYLRNGWPTGYLTAYPNQTIDSIIDAATLRETYTSPFAEAIRAGAGGIMNSYNQLNGSFAAENGDLLLGLLKEELNFHGFVLTDYGAGKTTLGSALNGTDAILGIPNLFGAALGAAIANGSVPEAILDDKLTRILTPYFALGQSSLPKVDYDRWVANKTSTIVAREVTEGAISLLKNTNVTNLGLPLKNVRDVALIGSAAAPSKFGILNSLSMFWNKPSSPYSGVITDGFGSGSCPAPYISDPLTGFIAAGKEQDRPVAIDGFFSDDPTEGIVIGETGPISPIDTRLAKGDAVFVFVSAVAMEGYDRPNLELLNNGSNLIQYAASRNNNTIVVIEGPGPLDLSQWHAHPNVTAILFSYFGGQEFGSALANIAFGSVNPSGKLPFTIAKQVSDYPLNLYNGSITINPIANFTEGDFIDYKHFDEAGVDPLYEFGYGLSYSTFAVSDISAWPKTGPCPAPVRETNEKLYIDGELSSMGVYDYAATVQATVTNTGEVDGAEVAQLYVTYPDGIARKMPVKSLRGFAKPYLKAGESQTVQFELRNKDLAYWSAVYHGWVVPRGDFTFHVGTSSRNLPLQTLFTF
ncbi:hypothetical protein JCM10908_001595 [Rhodotorula pacifica]|uniref:uncharacterized protein n=1 Tax=Rhodotorula pacifica TaxID=1495444 RepID=UPI0031751D1E